MGGGVVGPVVGGVVGGVVVVVPPVQVTPLSVNEAGAGLVPDHDPMKPTEALALVASEPFQDALVTVTCGPDWANVPPQPWLTFCAVVGKSKPSDQAEIASPRLVIARSPWKPPDQEPVTL